MEYDRRGVRRARRQLLLAAELTVDGTVAERLADLERRLERLLEDGRFDPDALAAVDERLTDVRADTHPSVRDAIRRAQTLLASCRSEAG